jgi:hypothetical protein
MVGGLWSVRPPASLPARIHGEVTDGQSPVPGARIHFQGHARPVTNTNEAGHFSLPLGGTKSGHIAAWKEGYSIAAVPGDRNPLRLVLRRLPSMDHEDYAWVDPTPDLTHANRCGNCHAEIHREWSASAHANSVHNRRFQNLYAGTDWQGRASPSWNLLAEHRLGAGVCATCHAPTFADATLEYDLRKVSGVAARSVHCDYCHKVVDAPTDKLGTRFGRDGWTLLRPPDQQQLFFGPLDDAHRQGEAFGYSPLYKESRYCASCHEGVIFGVHVYGTYSEWLASPAYPQGKQCQSCHMAATGRMTNIAPGKGGIEREASTLASHRFPGGKADMLRACLDVAVTLTPDTGGIRARVEVLAHDVGHRVPTGFIDRNLLLVVEAFDRADKSVRLEEGPTLPAIAGQGVVGLPGWLYAKQLKSPDGLHPLPFWLAQDEPEDTRLLPGRMDRREFRFGAGVQRARVRLLYRRFWQEVADSKGWPDNELAVVDRTLTLRSK